MDRIVVIDAGRSSRRAPTRRSSPAAAFTRATGTGQSGGFLQMDAEAAE
jgi:hypothetical protein